MAEEKQVGFRAVIYEFYLDCWELSEESQEKVFQALSKICPVGDLCDKYECPACRAIRIQSSDIEAVNRAEKKGMEMYRRFLKLEEKERVVL